MKPYFLFLSFIILLRTQAQNNMVFSGSEFINYGVIDIAAGPGVKWGTDRTPAPGYFTLVDHASFTGCSNQAHIDGYIKKIGNLPFVFPVGDGNIIRTIEISAPEQFTDAYAVAWIKGDPSQTDDPTGPFAGKHNVSALAAPLSAVSTIGEWDWQAGNLGEGTTGTGEGIFITVSIPDMKGFARPEELRLAGWNGKTWIDLSGIPTASGNSENSTLKGIMQPGISAIGIGRIKSAFPFRVTSFSSSAEGCNTILTCKVISEALAGRIIIEQSNDGKNFVHAGLVDITEEGEHIYTTRLSQPRGNMYYRLVSEYNNGTWSYSNVLQQQTSCSTPSLLHVFPNPVTAGTGQVYVDFTTAYRGRANCNIYNNLGQLLSAKEFFIGMEENRITADISTLKRGMYYIKLTGENGTLINTAQKLIIE